MLIANQQLAQGSEDWLEFRKSKFTASNTPIVMGESTYSNVWKYKKEFLGIEQPVFDEFAKKAMAHGQEHEALVRQAMCALHNTDYVPALVTLDSDNRFIASLDGISLETNELIEIKCPVKGIESTTWKDADAGKVSKKYFYQVQHQLMCSKAKKAYFVVFNAENGDMRIVEVEPREDYFEAIKKGWSDFISNVVECDTPEFPLQLVSELRNLESQAKATKSRIDEIKAQLKDIVPAGAKNFESNGLKFTRYFKTGAVDYEAILKDQDIKDLTPEYVAKFKKPDVEITFFK